MSPPDPHPSDPKKPAIWYQVLRGASLPLLIIMLIAGLTGLVSTVQMWIDLSEKPPEGWGAGFVGMAVMLMGLLSLLATLLSGTWLWLLWRPKKK
jgi:hypothetical protein